MVLHYLIGITAFLLLSTAWFGVQRAWRRSFPEIGAGSDPDVLAGRSSCHSCDDSKDCHRRPESGACKAQEDRP